MLLRLFHSSTIIFFFDLRQSLIATRHLLLLLTTLPKVLSLLLFQFICLFAHFKLLIRIHLIIRFFLLDLISRCRPNFLNIAHFLEVLAVLFVHKMNQMLLILLLFLPFLLKLCLPSSILLCTCFLLFCDGSNSFEFKDSFVNKCHSSFKYKIAVCWSKHPVFRCFWVLNVAKELKQQHQALLRLNCHYLGLDCFICSFKSLKLILIRILNNIIN